MSSGHLFCADRNGVKKLSVLAQDYPSAPANPSSLAKRDARGWREALPISSIYKISRKKRKKYHFSLVFFPCIGYNNNVVLKTTLKVIK